MASNRDQQVFIGRGLDQVSLRAGEGPFRGRGQAAPQEGFEMRGTGVTTNDDQDAMPGFVAVLLVMLALLFSAALTALPYAIVALVVYWLFWL